jgi:hypothetical protein
MSPAMSSARSPKASATRFRVEPGANVLPFCMNEPLERDDPIPVRTVCDAPEAVMEALRSLPEYGEAVVVEHDGKPIGAIIPLRDLGLYQRLFFDREMEYDVAAAERAMAEGGETIPIEELLDELGITVDA